MKDLTFEQFKKETEFTKLLSPIRYFTVWSYVARHYFSKSPAWLSCKMHGNDGNGKDGDFTLSEREIMKNALYDMSAKFREVADSIVLE